ncbi:hypothetical protein Syun_029383 [Stephania yunnanensis]|uniref:Reverse transcriptase n=1 Tax=Stephania yunnanensis TaxID=152371 RepID=A0AAP0E5H3_9MAGN
MEQRPDGWKSKLLNIAGLTTLIKSVTLAIPLYTIQCLKLPSSTCDKIDRLQRDFLWGSYPENQKLHIIKWSVVFSLQNIGGLGIREAADINRALLAKLAWRILHSPAPISASPIWKAITVGVRALIKGLRWRIGNG